MKRNGNKLNIAFLDFDDLKNPLLSGGQARATFEVARRLASLGHKITIITNRYPGSHDYSYQGIHYKHIGIGTSNLRINNLAFFLALPLTIRSLTADVIVECFTAPISTCFSPLFTKIPVIGMPTMFEAKEFSRKYHLPFHLIEKFGCKFYKYFLAYSASNSKKMRKLNPKILTRIIPNGISEEFFKQKEYERGYALFIGRIDIVQKGLDLLLSSISKIKKQLDIRIIIAGNGPDDQEIKLKRLIDQYDLGDKVLFIGRVDGRRKQELLANCTFGIYPSRFEDFPLVPLEFAAFRKPLICFDIDGLAWIPKDVSLKAKPFKVQELSANILKLARDNNFRTSLKRKCLNFARRYGWNNIALDYQKFFNEIIDIEKSKKKVAIT